MSDEQIKELDASIAGIETAISRLQTIKHVYNGKLQQIGDLYGKGPTESQLDSLVQWLDALTQKHTFPGTGTLELTVPELGFETQTVTGAAGTETDGIFGLDLETLWQAATLGLPESFGKRDDGHNILAGYYENGTLFNGRSLVYNKENYDRLDTQSSDGMAYAPEDSFCECLKKAYPLAATSENRSGAARADTIDELLKTLNNDPAIPSKQKASYKSIITLRQTMQGIYAAVSALKMKKQEIQTTRNSGGADNSIVTDDSLILDQISDILMGCGNFIKGLPLDLDNIKFTELEQKFAPMGFLNCLHVLELYVLEHHNELLWLEAAKRLNKESPSEQEKEEGLRLLGAMDGSKFDFAKFKAYNAKAPIPEEYQHAAICDAFMLNDWLWEDPSRIQCLRNGVPAHQRLRALITGGQPILFSILHAVKGQTEAFPQFVDHLLRELENDPQRFRHLLIDGDVVTKELFAIGAVIPNFVESAVVRSQITTYGQLKRTIKQIVRAIDNGSVGEGQLSIAIITLLKDKALRERTLTSEYQVAELFDLLRGKPMLQRYLINRKHCQNLLEHGAKNVRRHIASKYPGVYTNADFEPFKPKYNSWTRLLRRSVNRWTQTMLFAAVGLALSLFIFLNPVSAMALGVATLSTWSVAMMIAIITLISGCLGAMVGFTADSIVAKLKHYERFNRFSWMVAPIVTGVFSALLVAGLTVTLLSMSAFSAAIGFIALTLYAKQYGSLTIFFVSLVAGGIAGVLINSLSQIIPRGLAAIRTYFTTQNYMNEMQEKEGYQETSYTEALKALKKESVVRETADVAVPDVESTTDQRAFLTDRGHLIGHRFFYLSPTASEADKVMYLSDICAYYETLSGEQMDFAGLHQHGLGAVASTEVIEAAGNKTSTGNERGLTQTLLRFVPADETSDKTARWESLQISRAFQETGLESTNVTVAPKGRAFFRACVKKPVGTEANHPSVRVKRDISLEHGAQMTMKEVKVTFPVIY